MNETTLKMAAIRIGDTIAYRNARGTVSRAVVDGWRDAHDGRERLLLLNNDTHITLDQVIERQRKGKVCGAGTIVFEEEASA